jgi:hypothetical protein
MGVSQRRAAHDQHAKYAPRGASGSLRRSRGEFSSAAARDASAPSFRGELPPSRFEHDFSRVQTYSNARPGRAADDKAQQAADGQLPPQLSGDAAPAGASVTTSPGVKSVPNRAVPTIPAAPASTADETSDGPKPVQLDSPPQAAPISKVTSQTVATSPAKRGRTKLGIGEEVVCSTQPATPATWSVVGGGAVAPAAGNSTTFTASKSPSKSTVKATAGGKDVAIDFEVIAPDGLTAKVSSNVGLGTPGPPNNQVGFETIFDCIVTPSTVSFYNVAFRENIPKNDWTWPDGTADSKGPKVVPWNVGFDNKTTDDVSRGPDPVAVLSKGGKPVDFALTIKVPEDFQNEAGTWVSWLPDEEHLKEYAGATLKARGTLKATNSASGSWQGPWK